MSTGTRTDRLAAELGPDPDLTILRAGQVSLLYSKVPFVLYGCLAETIIFVIALWKFVPQELLIGWVIALLAVQGSVHLLVFAYNRASPPPETALLWGRRYAGLCAIMGVVWAIGAVAFFPSHSPVGQLLISLFLVTLATGACLAFDALTECFLPWIILLLVPSCLRYLYEGTDLQLLIGTIGLIYTVALIIIAGSSHNAILEFLRLKIEKDKLINSLQELRKELEARVAERTENLRTKNEELQNAEQSLRKHKETLEALLNAATDVAILLDNKATILALNHEAESTLCGRSEDLVGTNVFQYRQLPLNAKRRIGFEDLILKGKPWREVDVGSDGRIYDTSASPVFGSDGDVEGIALFARDVTVEKKAEEELRKSENKYRKILETIADGYHEVDLAGNFTLVNDSMCEILGYNREELLRMNFRAVMDETNAIDVFRAYDAVYDSEVPNHSFTYQIIRKDGATRDVSASMSLIRDQGPQPCGFRGILRDETDRRHLEERLRQSAKMEAIGRMAGGIAHDFNNLLTAVIGYSDILERQIGSESPHYRKIQQISRASQRGAELIKQLLAFGRKQILDMKVLSVRQLIGELEDMLRILIGEDIEFTTELSQDLGNIKADPAQLTQIIINLAVNARDAMPGGGRLIIEAMNAVLDEQYVYRQPDLAPGRYVTISVSDTGQGMDADTCAHAFDPFFTTKNKEFGTGLGLSTVYGIVKQHGGHVAIYTEPGLGTTFKVYFPLVEAPTEKGGLKVAPFTRPKGNEVILLVEDEDTVRNLASEALELLGYVVLKAGFPDEAIDICKNYNGRIDLLLTDVVLPKMDGKSLFEALGPLRPEMKVLFVSGYTENFIVHHGVLDPGLAFLHKPFSMDALACRVREVLGRGPLSSLLDASTMKSSPPCELLDNQTD